MLVSIAVDTLVSGFFLEGIDPCLTIYGLFCASVDADRVQHFQFHHISDVLRRFVLNCVSHCTSENTSILSLFRDEELGINCDIERHFPSKF